MYEGPQNAATPEPVKFGAKPFHRMPHEVAEAFLTDMFEREPEKFAVYYMRAMGVDGLMPVKKTRGGAQ